MNWSDLTEKQQQAIEKAYRSGQEPGEIAKEYGLKAKQVSDQAYRKKWTHPGSKTSTKKAAKKTAKKEAKKVVKKAVKKTAKKVAKKAAKKAAKKKTSK